MKKVTDINKKREQRGEDFYCKEIESLVYEIGKISGKTADFTFQEMRNIPREKRRQFIEEVEKIRRDLRSLQKKLL